MIDGACYAQGSLSIKIDNRLSAAVLLHQVSTPVLSAGFFTNTVTTSENTVRVGAHQVDYHTLKLADGPGVLVYPWIALSRGSGDRVDCRVTNFLDNYPLEFDCVGSYVLKIEPDARQPGFDRCQVTITQLSS